MTNTRIEDIMYRAGLTVQGCWDELDSYDRNAIMTFADLIVRECAQIADDGFASSNFGNGITGQQLLKHFGVEE